MVVRLRAKDGTTAEVCLPAEDIDSSSDVFDNPRIVAAFRPDGELLAVALKSGDVGIFSVSGEAWACFRTGEAHRHPFSGTDIACDPCGAFIIANHLGRDNVELWDWQGNRIRTLNTHGEKVLGVAISPDGERIVAGTGTGDGLQMFARDGDRIAAVKGERFTRVVFDEGRRYIALTGLTVDGSLAILDWMGESLARLAGPLGAHLVDTACSPGGDLIAALFSDGTTRIWSAPERRRTKSLQMPDARVIAFSGDGKMLLAASAAGRVTCHPMNIDDLFGTAAQRVSRPLLPDELERFGIDSPCLDAEALQGYRAAVATAMPGGATADAKGSR